MVKIKIDETYSIGLADRLNIVLLKYGPVMVPKKVNGKTVKVQDVVDGQLQVDSKGNPIMRVAEWVVAGYKDEVIGAYGRSFSLLVQGMIYNKVSDAAVKDVEALDQYIKDFVEGINFDGIIKEFHQKIMDLERERKHLEKKLKKAMDKGKE